MSEWIRVKDRLPKYGQMVLATDGKSMAVSIFKCVYGDIGIFSHDFVRDIYYEEFDGVTHWKPLPELPKEAETKHNCYDCANYKGDRTCGFDGMKVKIAPENGCSIWEEKGKGEHV